MPTATPEITILCPRCGCQYTEASPMTVTALPDEIGVPETPLPSQCPLCGQTVDLGALNVFSTGGGIVYLDYTVYPDLLQTALPPLDQHPAAVYLYRLTTERSRTVMSQALRVIAALLTGQDARTADILGLRWEALRYPHTVALRTRLAALYSPATANRTLAALRSVLKEAWRLGLMSAEDYHRAADVPNISGETLPAGRDLSAGEVLALVNACARDVTPAGVRDAALIGVLYSGGLRRAEVAALEMADVETTSGKLTVRNGKGRKGRTVYLQGGALDALLDWLAVRGDEPGALFVPVNKGGRLVFHGMTAQAVYNLVAKRAAEAGVKDFSPHDFRRTFVGDLLDRGVDIVTVQRLAGHADPKTTARYDRRPETVKQQAAAKLHYPYQRRRTRE